jgi:hypothetical protein
MNKPRALVVYSSVLTVTMLAMLVSGFAGRKATSFDEITVQRINIIEPDGTLRTIISNKSAAPGLFVKGKESAREDPPTAGMIFLNDEGSEIGGLIFGGSKDSRGNVESHGHLSFDQYMASEVFAIDAYEQDNERSSRLQIFDWRERPGENSQTRLVLGKTPDRAVGLGLKDSHGRDRILLRIKADDSPELLFLDPAGKIVSRLPTNKTE